MKFSSRLLASLICLQFVATALAFNIKGTIIDSTSQPEAYATVRIFAASDTIHAAALGVTDDLGSFDLPVKKAGQYNVIISSVGKIPINRTVGVSDSGPTADLGVITIADNAAQLGEIDVVATKPLVVKEIDRLGYDVQADEDAKTATVQDILRKVPMVTVDADGTVKVRGNTNFKIYKNGRPNNAFTSNAKDIFAAIPASMIKKIEVITDPGAKEDAEGVGAILNIVTNETTSINGVMGNVGLEWDLSNSSPMPNLWLQSNIGKVAFSAYGGFFHQDKKLSKSTSENYQTFTETGNTLANKSVTEGTGDMGFFGIDGSYELDSLNLFTLEFGGFFYNGKNNTSGSTTMTDPLGNAVYSYSQLTNTPRARYLDLHGNFNYQRLTRLKGEVITLSYQLSHNNNKNISESEYFDLYNFPADYSGINVNSRLNFIEHTGQLDWTRPLGEHNKVSVGAKVIARSNESLADNEYIGDRTDHTDFTHRTTVGAGYFDYRYTLGRFNARAGLRYEYSRLSAKFNDGTNPDFASSLNDWVPNASVMWNVNDASSMKLSYSTRINRPGISFLNPAESRTPASASYGNPDLESIHYNNIGLNYSLIKQNFNLDATLSYEFANNTITQLVSVDSNDFTTSTYGNVGRTRDLELSLFAQWSITPKTNVILNSAVFYNHIKIPEISRGRWGAEMFLRASQQLPFKLRLEGFLFYGYGRLQNVYSYDASTIRNMFHGFSLQRSFLKEDRLTVKAGWLNPFLTHGHCSRTITDRGSYTGTNYSSFKGARRVEIGVSYRFGSVKAGVKKTTASIVNDDLQGGNKQPATTQSQGSI